MLIKWRHSGFNVFCGPKIQPGDENTMENLARYIVRASFSQERMTYVPEEAKVIYQSKACPRPRSGNGKEEKTFDALEWLAAMCSHVPNKGESFDLEALDRQMVRYYGHYSNVSRGKNEKTRRGQHDTFRPRTCREPPGRTSTLMWTRYTARAIPPDF